jgi:hypothetical protein
MLRFFSQQQNQFLSHHRIIPDHIILNRVFKNSVDIIEIELSETGINLKIDKNIKKNAKVLEIFN